MPEINNKATEEWKNCLDALRFTSRTHREVRNQRRTTQLQVFFTATTFYALIGAAKFTGRLQIPQTHRICFVVGTWLLVVGVAVLSAVYLLGLNASNRVNRKIAESAEREIMRMVNLPDPVGAGRTIAKTYFWEIAMIAIFAAAAGISVTLF